MTVAFLNPWKKSTPLRSYHILGFSAFRVQVGDQMETVFLLSGNDPAIHLYKEVRWAGWAESGWDPHCGDGLCVCRRLLTGVGLVPPG